MGSNSHHKLNRAVFFFKFETCTLNEALAAHLHQIAKDSSSNQELNHSKNVQESLEHVSSSNLLTV